MYNRKLVFLSACFGILLFGMGLITLGSIQPDLRTNFKLGDIASGTLFSILPVGILIGSLIFGPVCDRYGYKLLLIFSAVLMAVTLEGIAFAGSLDTLKICVFFFGLGGGAINGATNALVADISEQDKGANLSILGIFFGAGALGMPVLVGALKKYYAYDAILSFIGIFIFLIALFIFFVRFPVPKNKQGFPLKKSVLLFSNRFLILVAFFLFFQSSFEAIVNNWTTLYLVDKYQVQTSSALFALSLYVVGLMAIRLLLGSVFRKVSGMRIMFASLFFIGAGLAILKFSVSFPFAVAGLVTLGVGMSAGFPVMLGYVGARFTDLSATAFSFVLVIALLGNILINYVSGMIIQQSGIHQVIHIGLIELCGMFILCLLIRKNL